MGADSAIDIDLPIDPNLAVRTALWFVDDRIGDLWQADDLTYPSEYAFTREYGPGLWG